MVKGLTPPLNTDIVKQRAIQQPAALTFCEHLGVWLCLNNIWNYACLPMFTKKGKVISTTSVTFLIQMSYFDVMWYWWVSAIILFKIWLRVVHNSNCYYQFILLSKFQTVFTTALMQFITAPYFCFTDTCYQQMPKSEEQKEKKVNFTYTFYILNCIKSNNFDQLCYWDLLKVCERLSLHYHLKFKIV